MNLGSQADPLPFAETFILTYAAEGPRSGRLVLLFAPKRAAIRTRAGH
jgi:hypothetical protein